jgi:hypothetical protein
MTEVERLWIKVREARADTESAGKASAMYQKLYHAEQRTNDNLRKQLEELKSLLSEESVRAKLALPVSR